LVLRRLECQVFIARDGQAALDLAQRHMPHLVLVDLLLPRVNGLELVRQLRQFFAPRATPILVISALGFGEVIQQVVAAGARDFILKPFEPDLLEAKVRQYLPTAVEQSVLAGWS
jgi:DNA-binding response OmpR family regulator